MARVKPAGGAEGGPLGQEVSVEGTPQPEGSRLFVRRSTGLVREASALDATIFNAVFSAPVGATLAIGVLWALSAFPGSDPVWATIIAVVLNIPVLIMMALLASSMPRTGGDYVWVSRILSPPLAMISNFAAALSAMIGATFWARFFPVFALGPILVGLGVFFDNTTMVEWGTNFQTKNEWIFGGALSMIVLMTLILVSGVKTTFRWQNAFWIIASLGTFIAFIAFLVGDSATFSQNFNSLNGEFGGGTTTDLIAAAGTTGVAPEVGNFDATLPTIFAIMVFMMWNWWSVYLSGELKSASDRGRQLRVMFGGLLWDGIFITIGLLLFFKVVPYDLAVALNSGPEGYAIPSGPWYHFLASLVHNIPILAVIILGSFLFWSLPAMVGNTFMPIRSVFAWAFDRLLPEKLAEVNERTHSPVPAILLVMALVTAMLAWSVLSTDFFTWLALGVEAGVVCVVIVGIAAIMFPTRRPDLYQASPANVRFAGVPVLYIVAPLSILVMLFLVYLTVTYPALALAGNPDNLWQIPAFMLMIVVIGLVLYYGAKMVRSGQGIDVDLVYRELPPD
ncbi:MAG TPA: APC family permease [Candidatus Binatia bacterium]|nr:APC family permease [Candidatus Binatia bacterium]